MAEKKEKVPTGTDLLQLLTDPENQPHQFVGKPDDLKELLAQAAQEEAADIVAKAQEEAAGIIKDAQIKSIGDMSLDELSDATEKVKQKELSESEKAEQELRKELFQKHGYELMIDVKYEDKILPAGSRNKLSKLKKAEIAKLLEKDFIRK
jgi:hypothetical protein